MTIQQLKDQLKKELAKEFIKKDVKFNWDNRTGGIWICGKGKKYHVGKAKDDWKIFASSHCKETISDVERNLPEAKSRSEVL